LTCYEHCDEFEVHHGHALGLQQQISEILVAATSVDQHANIPIDGLDYAKAHLGFAIVGNTVHVLQQRRREFLKRSQSLPLQLVHPPVQVVDHGPSVSVIPQPL
jgi:hypothetical protein